MHFKNVITYFLTILIVLASTTSLALANTIHTRAINPLKNEKVQKIYGKLSDRESIESCESGTVLDFFNPNGFKRVVFIGSELSIIELNAVDSGLGKGLISLDKESDKKITFCIPESVFDKISFEYSAKLTDSIYLWQKSIDYNDYRENILLFITIIIVAIVLVFYAHMPER